MKNGERPLSTIFYAGKFWNTVGLNFLLIVCVFDIIAQIPGF
jgi:hypothetical protein